MKDIEKINLSNIIRLIADNDNYIFKLIFHLAVVREVSQMIYSVFSEISYMIPREDCNTKDIKSLKKE